MRAPTRSRPTRTRKRLVAATVGLCALAATSCTTPSASGDAQIDEDAPTTTEAPPPAPKAETGEPIAAGTRRDGVRGCQSLAVGPWADLAHGPDPIADVKAGNVAAVPDGVGGPPDETTAIATLADYDDPATLEEPEVVLDAMEAAGFEGGAQARWGNDSNFSAITVLRFADADAAKDALTAHLTDLCERTVHATVRDDQAGLTLRRDSGAVRSVFLIDDLEVSVHACSCFGASDDEREALVQTWSDNVRMLMDAPTPG